jgi:hypothetical protein
MPIKSWLKRAGAGISALTTAPVQRFPMSSIAL